MKSQVPATIGDVRKKLWELLKEEKDPGQATMLSNAIMRCFNLGLGDNEPLWIPSEGEES